MINLKHVGSAVAAGGAIGIGATWCYVFADEAGSSGSKSDGVIAGAGLAGGLAAGVSFIREADAGIRALNTGRNATGIAAGIGFAAALLITSSPYLAS